MPKAKEQKAPRIPIAEDPARLTKAAERIQASPDARICKQFVHDERFTGAAFWLEPSGNRVDREEAEEMIRKGRFRPVADGLFADASSQTFERAA